MYVGKSIVSETQLSSDEIRFPSMARIESDEEIDSIDSEDSSVYDYSNDDEL